MRRILIGLAGADLVGLLAAPATAEPADRVAVAAGVVEAFECTEDIVVGGISCTTIGAGIPAGTSIIPKFLYKSNTAADLIFQFTTECTLFNYVKS